MLAAVAIILVFRPTREDAPAGRAPAAAEFVKLESIDVNLTDGQTHQLALYCLDWDSDARKQVVEVRDAGDSGRQSSAGRPDGLRF